MLKTYRPYRAVRPYRDLTSDEIRARIDRATQDLHALVGVPETDFVRSKRTSLTEELDLLAAELDRAAG